MRSAILLVSLSANLALAALILRNHRLVERVSPAPSEPRSLSETSALQKRLPAQTPIPAEEPHPPAEEGPAFQWSQLESPDYKEYIARLRAFGVPEKTVRDIIFADVAKLYRPRLAALRPSATARTNFWEEYNSYSQPRRTREQREQYRALQKEQSELLKTLLGEKAHDQRVQDDGGVDWFERSFGMVPPEQRDKVREMRDRHQEITADIYEKAGGYHDQEIHAELKAARKKFHDELATVLTPQQLDDYELRSSDTAGNMRYQLKTFEPNEEEFRSIFKYKQAMEDFTSERDSSDPDQRPSSEEMKARQQKQKEMEEEIAQSLGPERAKEFKFSEQYEYRNLLDAGVAKESVFRIAEMKEEVESAARKLRQDKTLSNEERTAALAAMRAETEKELVGLLGDRRARAYPGNGGHWLRSLSPRE